MELNAWKRGMLATWNKILLHTYRLRPDVRALRGASSWELHSFSDKRRVLGRYVLRDNEKMYFNLNLYRLERIFTDYECEGSAWFWRHFYVMRATINRMKQLGENTPVEEWRGAVRWQCLDS